MQGECPLPVPWQFTFPKLPITGEGDTTKKQNKNMVIEKLLSEILGDTKVEEKDYPKVDWLQVDGNAFSVMGTAKKAWRKLDAGVASRIAPVCMRGDYDTLLSLCIAVCPEGEEDDSE